MSFNFDTLFTALKANLHILRAELQCDYLEIQRVSGADFFYTDGSAVGAAFKINPFGFYYKEDGSPHFSSSGVDYELYGQLINIWIQNVISSLKTEL